MRSLLLNPLLWLALAGLAIGAVRFVARAARGAVEHPLLAALIYLLVRRRGR